MDQSISPTSVSHTKEHEKAFAKIMKQVVDHKFPAPNQAMVDLKYELNSTIERRANQRSAIQLMNTEQQQHIHHKRLKAVLSQLLANMRRHLAFQASSEEQQDRMLMISRFQLCDQLRRRVCQSGARLALDKESKERLSYWITDPVTIHRSKSAINNHILRRSDQQRAIQVMEWEQMRRITTNIMHSVCEAMVRKVNQQHVAAQVQLEHQQRITRDIMFDVCDQIRREYNIRAVIARADMEQSQRIAQQKTFVNAHPSQLTRYYGPSTMDTTKEAVHCDIRRRGNRIEADRSTKIEQMERICKNNYAMVLDNLRRKVAQANAAMAMDAEKELRCAQQHFSKMVCPELLSKTSRKTTWSHIAHEQQMRIESGVLRTYWIVDPVEIFEVKRDVNRSIDAMGSKISSSHASENELFSRIVEMKMRQTLAQLISTTNRNASRKAEMLEQAQRVTVGKTHQVCEELRRVVARKSAAMALDSEQKSRITTNRHTPPYNTNSAGMDSNTTASIKEVMSTIERMGNQKWARLSTEQERNERIITDRMHEVCDGIRRHVARRNALKAMLQEQECLVNRQSLSAVFAALVSAQNRKAAAMASLNEQQRLIQHRSSPPQAYRDLHDILCRELLTPVRLTPTAVQIECA